MSLKVVKVAEPGEELVKEMERGPWSIEEAAVFLRVSASKIADLGRRGEITLTKIDGQTRVVRESVYRYMARNVVQPKGAAKDG